MWMLLGDYRPGLTVRTIALPASHGTRFAASIGETVSDEPWRTSRKNNDYSATIRWRDGREQVLPLRRLEIVDSTSVGR
jgi:hypothetical protein